MQIVKMQPDFQIRDMVLNDEILDFGELKAQSHFLCDAGFRS